MHLIVQADRTLIPSSAKSARYVLLSFTAPESARMSERAPVNISLVIDRSGSMGGSKIELARMAVVQALQMLRPTDRFSVVCYDDEVDVLVPSTLATREAVGNAVAQVRGLAARGNTDLGAGWLKGCEQIAAHLAREQVGRCLLVSDGLANHGITDRGELARHAGELRQRGVTTSTFGVGADFDERLLEGMTIAGAGHFYNIETPVQIPDCLTSELGETLEVVARDVAVTVRAGDLVAVETLNRFPVDRADGVVAVRIGDLASRQDVALVLRLDFPASPEGTTSRAVFGIVDSAGVLGSTEADVIWTSADRAANDAQPRNVAVDRAVAELDAAKARAEALELNRAGHYEEAQARLHAVAERIAQYAGRDRELRAIISDLEEHDVAYSAPMSPRAIKAEHFASMNVAMMRTAEGKAKRKG